MATEFGVNVDPYFLRSYKSGQDLTDIFEQIEMDAANEVGAYIVLIAVSSDDDYKQLIKQAIAARDRLGIIDPWASPVLYFVSDVGDSPAVCSAGLPLYGLSPAAATMSGFDTYYYSLYKKDSPNGSAQVYDALTIAALGAAKRAGNPTGPDQLILDGEKVEYSDEPYGPNLSDWMRALVADKSGTVTTWTVDGLNKAFRLLSQGQNPNLTGATGKLLFDAKMHNTILQTTYWLWMTFGIGDRWPLINFSTHGDDGQVATLPTWEWQKLNRQEFEDFHVDHNLPDVKDHWALVVSPSTTWANYRHQADVLAVYQTLRHHGYDDDHIVVICEDNLANAPENKYPGKIYVENPPTPGSPFGDDDNVRKNAVIDYHFTDLQMDDIRKIILGDTDGGRLPQVLHTTAESNLFIFWSGHGADGRGMCWSDGSGSQIFTGERMRGILKELNDRDGYRRCMLAIETCFSGLIGEAIVGLPDVVAITAANTVEPSKADVHNRELGVFLSNAFSRAFRISINDEPTVTLRDLFYHLARTTTGSHVTLYNDINYGSVYTLNAGDYFPE
jgi:glycosylphosphatidylinositol transamidase (GPIT) subunit GPI8